MSYFYLRIFGLLISKLCFSLLVSDIIFIYFVITVGKFIPGVIF